MFFFCLPVSLCAGFELYPNWWEPYRLQIQFDPTLPCPDRGAAPRGQTLHVWDVRGGPASWSPNLCIWMCSWTSPTSIQLSFTPGIQTYNLLSWPIGALGSPGASRLLCSSFWLTDGPLKVGLVLHGAGGTSMASFRSSAHGGRRSRRAPVLWFGTLASPSAVSEWRTDSWVYRPQPAALSSHKNLWGARGDALGLLSDIPWKRGSGDTWLTAASVSWRAACCTEAKTRSVGPLCSLLDWNQIIWSVALKFIEHDYIYIARRHKTNTQHSWRENLHLRLKLPFKRLGSVILKKNIIQQSFSKLNEDD